MSTLRDPDCCQRCDGDGYLDIVDPGSGGVIGPRPCPECAGTGMLNLGPDPHYFNIFGERVEL